MSSHYVNRGAELTNFDKLALRLIITGAVVMIILHVALVDQARSLYSPLDEFLPGLTEIVLSPGFAASAVMLMIFCGYYAARVRRLYNASSASSIFLLGILLAISSNALFVYGIYAPAGGATDMLRHAGSDDDDDY